MNFLNFRLGHGQAGSQGKNRLRQVKRSVKIRHLEFFEGELEKRELLATTSFSGGMLSINFNAAGEILTLTNDGSKINISSTTAITGAGSSFATSGVNGLNVTNSGSLAGQSFNFGVGSTFSFSQSVSISGVGSVLVNSPINATGTASISATGANNIQTAGTLSTAGGALTLKATSDIVITQPILTNGGVQTLTADSDADGNGTLSLNFAIAQLQDPHPNAGNQFGASTLVLPSGNVVVTSPYDDAGGTDAGAVYLFNGFTGQVISTLTGFSPNDNIGSGGVVALTNGNYVVASLSWDNGSATDAGAVTWGNGTTGVSGTVNSTNSFVGNSTSDQIGSGGVTALANGNYVVISPYWDNASIKDVGAATWGNGTAGLIGKISSTNSLIGGNANDQVGSGGVTALTNCNYVVISRKWTNFGGFVESGAVTWGNGLTGISGNVSPANSFVGFYSYNWIGLGGVTALTNGNYVICSPREAGYVTWGNGFTGIIGTVSTTNSLCGNGDHQVGSGGVKALTNGNYVVCSPNWDNGSVVNAGAVTWGNGLTGISGNISTANSLVGTRASDMAGSSGVTALTNGNYVVLSPYLDNGSYRDAGAVTWGNGLTGISGSISTSNSLVGTRNLDMVGYGGPTGVTALTNGNYVVNSPWWGLGGAVTWGNGLTGISGVISSTNSLVSTVLHDDIGAGGVTALTNGNYVFSSPYWDNGSVVDTGSVTWCNGLTGMSGSINSTNSLVGTVANDRIGYDGVKALTNGNYIVCSPNWSMNVGAITWGNGSTGIKGGVSTTNSLTGNVANDFSGSRVTAFSGGNYVVVSPLWNNGSVADAGAVTWANGTTSVIGKVSTTNSAVGNSASSGLIEYASCFFGLNSFFVSLTKDGSGRILSGSQSSGFSQTSGSLNSGGGAIALQGNLVSLQNSINTSTANSIAITANNLNIAINGTLSASASGNVSIRTRGASVNLGNGTDTATSLGLSQDELNKITAGTLTIGSNITGSISLTNNLTWPSNLVLSSNANINGTLSNANQVFTQGSNNITAAGKISIAGVASAISISAGNNQSTTVGTDFATLLKVHVIDYIGNPVPNVTVTFTVNANGASGNFASTTAVKTDSTGYATAPKLTAKTVSGVYTVTASASGLSPLTFTLTNNPGAATSIAIVDGNNQSATVGTAFAKSLQVIAKDTYGNLVPGVSVVFTAPSTGASGTFAKSSIVTTNSSGVAASPQFTANTVTGVYTVTAAITGLTGLTFILANSAGTVSTLAIVDGNNQSALIGNAFTKPMQVVAKDSYGNLVPGLSVTFTAPSTGASGTFATSSTVTTNISGVAVSPVFTANTIAGTYSITASSTGSTTQNFLLINLPGVATKLAIVTGNNQTATVGNSFAITLQVLATDNFGNGVPGVQILYTAPSSGASGSFMGSNLVTTNNQGIAVSNPFTANSLAGNYIVTATSPGLSTQSFSLTNSTSGAIISITGGSNQSATVGTAFGSALQVKFTDSFGNPVPGVSVTFSSPATGPGITFGGAATVVSNALGFATSPAITANGKAGSFTVTASVTNVGSVNFTLTNTAGAAATIVTKSGNNQTATVNTAFGSPLIARVLDSYGNPVSGCSVTFSNPGAGAMAVFGGSNVVTSNADGMAASPPLSANTVSEAYIVTASAANVSALQFTLNNAAGLPASIVKTGGNNQGATANTAFTSPLSVKVSDIYGNPVPNVNIAFSGPLTGSGLVFAGASTVSTNVQGIAATPAITANSVAGTYNVQAYVNVQVAALFTLTNLTGMAKKLLMTGGNNQAATVNMAFATPIPDYSSPYGNFRLLSRLTNCIHES